MTDTVRATNPAAIQIAEYWNEDRASALHPPPDGLGFDAELGDGLRNALRDLLRQASAGASAMLDLSGVANALVVPAAIPEGWRLVQCLENQDLTFASHSDAARVAMLADSLHRTSWYARSRSRTVTGLLLAAPGIPALFMGQEWLEDKNWSDNRQVDGLIGWTELDGAGSARRDFQKFVTDMIALRRSQPALRGSRATPVDRFAPMDRGRRPGCGRDSQSGRAAETGLCDRAAVCRGLVRTAQQRCL
jgi:1,4-alpha-glucan branching enzyme